MGIKSKLNIGFGQFGQKIIEKEEGYVTWKKTNQMRDFIIYFMIIVHQNIAFPLIPPLPSHPEPNIPR